MNGRKVCFRQINTYNYIVTMLPKIEGKRSIPQYYPKLLSSNSNDETILKLKILQQFLQQDTYTARPALLQQTKQFSLQTCRHNSNNQENLKKYIPNISNELPANAKPKKQNIPPKKEYHSRPQTKRECIRLNELVQSVQKQRGGASFRRELNLGNFKML